VLRAVGVVPRGGNYEMAWARIRAWGIEAPHLQRHDNRAWTYSDEEVRQTLASSGSLAGAQRLLGRKPSGAGYRFLRRQIVDLGIDTSHMLGEGWRLGSRRPPVPALPLSFYLVKGRKYASEKLRRRLIEEGIKAHRCECCALEEWLGKQISLELDHKNGDRFDNRLENLRLLCPNCHAQTDTYRGRNIGRANTWL
jgi:hypothetical protein